MDGSEQSAIVLILKNLYAGDVLHHFSDPNGHFLLMVIFLNNTVVILINIYGYKSFHENFNIVPNNILDRLPHKQSSSTNSKCKIFMDKLDVTDIWREKFPNIKSYTWSNKSWSRQSHTDYWLVPQSVRDFNVSDSILPSPMTDHKATLIQSPLSSGVSSSRPRTSYWKHNSSLLKCDQLRKNILFLIKHYWIKAQKKNKYAFSWELLKHEVDKCARNFGSHLTKLNRLEEDSVTSKIMTLCGKMQEGLSDAE